MHDVERGMIKWAAFASVIDPNFLVTKICDEKGKNEKPILSEDDYFEIESNVLSSFECKNTIEIHYYKNGYIYKEIDKFNKTIILNNKKTIKFNCIIKTYIH